MQNGDNPCWTHLVEVDLDTADIRRTDRDHAEEAVLPPAKKSYPLVQHKQILQPLRHPRREREEVA